MEVRQNDIDREETMNMKPYLNKTEYEEVVFETLRLETWSVELKKAFRKRKDRYYYFKVLFTLWEKLRGGVQSVKRQFTQYGALFIMI